MEFDVPLGDSLSPQYLDAVQLFVPNKTYQGIKDKLNKNSTWGIRGFISIQNGQPKLVVEKIIYIGEMQNGK